MCSNRSVRWDLQAVTVDDGALPGLARAGLVRSVQTPEFAGMVFHEVLAKSALSHVRGGVMPFAWTINPYRGCSHACTYCFARSTHAYLGLDSGHDFDTRIVVKVNAVDVLRAELARPSWRREQVALGTNTDPYQRAEGRYRLMPGIIDALAAADTPLSILTKGTLLRRDLPLLAEAAERVRVSLAVSLATIDGDLARVVDPGAPTSRARLDLIRAVRAAGFGCRVMIAPVLPWLTDSRAHLAELLDAVRGAGATAVTVVPLNLKPGAREWFFAWLRREHPEHVAGYERVYPRGPQAIRGYRQWLDARVGPLLAQRGYEPEDRGRRRGTGGARSGPFGATPCGAESGSPTRSGVGIETTLF